MKKKKIWGFRKITHTIYQYTIYQYYYVIVRGMSVNIWDMYTHFLLPLTEYTIASEIYSRITKLSIYYSYILFIV